MPGYRKVASYSQIEWEGLCWPFPERFSDKGFVAYSRRLSPFTEIHADDFSFVPTSPLLQRQV
jgi:hypothetical protein